MQTELDLKEFNGLRHKVATSLDRLEQLSNSSVMGDEALRGLALMRQDGKQVRGVLDAASKTRVLPTSFVAEVDAWLSKVEEITSFVDESPEESR